MAIIDLSIATTYVQDWTVQDALRELFQNAIDQETCNPKNDWVWDYNKEREMLTIISNNSVLERGSLLLGCSTKQDSTTTIGKFGEGYKLGLMVLLRNGLRVSIYNHQKQERWDASIRHSEAFDQDVLSFELLPYPSDITSLQFVIKGIDLFHMEELKALNLNLKGYPKHLKTHIANVLTEDYQKGRVYINGLYVETMDTLAYGYDFKPEHLSLDRDRKRVSSFDLRWKTSAAWLILPEFTLVLKLLKDNSDDVNFVANNDGRSKHLIADKAYEAFRAEHGENAVPVTTQEEFDMIAALGEGYKPVFIPAAYNSMVRHSSYYREIKVGSKTIAKMSPTQIIKRAFFKADGKPKTGMQKKLVFLLEQSKNWKVK